MPQTFQQWSAVRHKPKNDGCHILDGQSSRKWNVHNFVSVFQKLTVNSCQFTSIRIGTITKALPALPGTSQAPPQCAPPLHERIASGVD